MTKLSKAAMCLLGPLLCSPTFAESIAPERARLLLKASAALNAGAGLEFAETVTFRQSDGRQKLWARNWKFRGDMYRGPMSCRERTGAKDRYTVREGTRVYSVYKVKTHWIARIELPQPHHFPVIGLIQRYLRPFNNGSWDVCLARQPIVLAETSGNRLRVFFALAPVVADAIQDGRPNSGFVGWMTEFEEFEGELVLKRVSGLATAKLFEVLPGTEGLKYRPNPDILEGPEIVIKGTAYGTAMTVEFAEFLRVGNVRVPTRVRIVELDSNTTGVIDPVSIRTVDLEGSAFSFRPPTEFGGDGHLVDKLSGAAASFGSLPLGGGDSLVAAAVRQTDRYEQQRGSSMWGWFVGTAFALGLATIGFMWIRRA